MRIQTLQDIDTTTEEGKLLVAALMKLSTESQQTKTVGEIIHQVSLLSYADETMLEAAGKNLVF